MRGRARPGKVAKLENGRKKEIALRRDPCLQSKERLTCYKAAEVNRWSRNPPDREVSSTANALVDVSASLRRESRVNRR